AGSPPARELPPPGRRGGGVTARRRDGLVRHRGPRRARGDRPMSEAVRAALSRVIDGELLSRDEAGAAMGAVMDGEATQAQLAALLVALRMRGETVDELAGFATAMRDRALHVDAPAGAIDVVGTGGDKSGTFNVSTTAALVVAASGVPVAKHGNRAITSQAGSADVLDALGVRIDHDPESAGIALREIGFAFLFAQTFHPARDRGPDGVQPAGSADQPGRSHAGAHRCRGRGRGTAGRRGRRPARDG